MTPFRPQDWPSALAAFLAALVEFTEALTVVLAVGATRGWLGALSGTAAALVLLLVATAILGPALAAIPLATVQTAVGILVLLFGMRWLRKAVLRAAGILPLHDESVAFTAQTERLGHAQPPDRGWDAVGFATAFKMTALEGVEVVFIIIAVGAGNADLLWPASLGALAALGVVIVLGVAIHRPLTRIPENTLKLAVGILLTAFGTFWTGEGLGFTWPRADWSLPGLIAGFLVAALAAVRICRASGSLFPEALT